jgi:outer membrane protein W
MVSATAVALLASGGTVARADDDEDGGSPHQHVDFGIFVGSMTFDEVVDSDNGPLFGIRAGYDMNLHWGVELVAGWQNSNLESDATVSRDHTVVASTLQYSFRFDGDQMVVPYVGAGIGGWQEDTDNGAAQNEFLFHGVVGLRFRASKHAALMIDVREWFVPWYNPYRRKDVNANSESVQVHFAYRF